MKNQTMMQYFEWYLPQDGRFWQQCRAQAEELRKAGVFPVNGGSVSVWVLESTAEKL